MRWILLALAWVFAIAPTQARAVLTTLRQFNPPQISGLCGIATDAETGDVWLYECSGTDILRFDGNGTFLSSFPRPGESANDVDVEIAPVAFTLGGTLVPAGTILFINGETGVAEIFAVDGSTGAVLQTLVTDFGVSHVVGGAYHPARGTFFLIQDRVPGNPEGNRVAEIDATTGDVLNTFSTDAYFDVNYGDIDACGSTGNLFLVSSVESRVAEITAEGALIQYHELPSGVSALSGIGQDDATGNTWVGGTGGNAWFLAGLPCGAGASAPEPAPYAASLSAGPNPARGPVTIRYSLVTESPVEIRVHDVAGRRVHSAIDGRKPAGQYEVVWNGRDGSGSRVPPGVYFYTVQAGSWKARGGIVLVD